MSFAKIPENNRGRLTSADDTISFFNNKRQRISNVFYSFFFFFDYNLTVFVFKLEEKIEEMEIDGAPKYCAIISVSFFFFFGHLPATETSEGSCLNQAKLLE